MLHYVDLCQPMKGMVIVLVFCCTRCTIIHSGNPSDSMVEVQDKMREKTTQFANKKSHEILSSLSRRDYVVHLMLGNNTVQNEHKQFNKFHLKVQQGRKTRTLFSRDADLVTKVSLSSSFSKNAGTNVANQLSTQITLSVISKHTESNKLTVSETKPTQVGKNIKSKISAKAKRAVTVTTTNKLDKMETINQASTANFTLIENDRNMSLNHFLHNHINDKLRSSNAVWAMVCMTSILILLFGCICYTRLWKKRHAGSWIDNMDPKDHLYQEEDFFDVIRSRAKFLPIFTKKSNGQYTYLKEVNKIPTNIETIAEEESEEDNSGSDSDDIYKPLL